MALAVLVLGAAVARTGETMQTPQLPAEWLAAWANLHPATGAIEPAAAAGPNSVRVSLAGRQAVLLIQER